MNRRALFGLLSVSPIAAAGAALGASSRHEAPDATVPSITLDAKDGALRIQSGKRPPELAPTSYGQFSRLKEGPDVHVSLSIGKDGRLWAKCNGRWERVATA